MWYKNFSFIVRYNTLDSSKFSSLYILLSFFLGLLSFFVNVLSLAKHLGCKL